MDERVFAFHRQRTQQAIARQVRTYRRYRGLRQTDLAAQVGYVQSTISRIERGQLLPSTPHLIALAVALQVPLTELVRLERPAPI